MKKEIKDSYNSFSITAYRVTLIGLVLLLALMICGCSRSKDSNNSNNSNGGSTSVEGMNSGVTNNNTGEEQAQGLVDLNKYVSVEYSGYNYAGTARCGIDKEQFLLDNIDIIRFNPDTEKVYKELYGDTRESAASTVLRYISVKASPGYRLTNEDSINVEWTIDEEKVKTYFLWDYSFSDMTLTVEGLTEAEAFDPFEGLEVSYSGNAPFATVGVYNYNYYGRPEFYDVNPKENLKNGDIITVKFTCEDKGEAIEYFGKYPSCYEKEFTVSGLKMYPQSVNDLSTEEYQKLVSTAASKIWVRGYGEYRDAEYCGNVFCYVKDQPLHGVHFLRWSGLPVYNTVCFVFSHPEYIDGSTGAAADTVYSIVAVENLLIDEEGKCSYGADDLWVMMSSYSSTDEVISTIMKEDCIELLNFENNLNF